MKINVKSYLWLVFAGMIGLSSCKKEDENAPAPSLTFTLNGASSANFNAGEIAEFKMDLNSTIDFTSLKGTLSYTNTSNSTTTVTIKDANFSNAELDYTKNSDIQNNYKGTKIVKVALPSNAKRGTNWTISVVSANANGSTTSTFTGRIVYYWENPVVLLGARKNNAGSFFAPSTGEVFISSNAIANVGIIDFTYAWDSISTNQQNPVIASYFERTALGFLNVPSNARKTTFASASNVTPQQFLDPTSSWTTLTSNLSFGPAEKITIEINKVYAFKNQDGKIGLFHVNEIESGSSGSVKLLVKF